MAQEEPVGGSPPGERPVRVRRGRVDSVDLYEIKDSELDMLEKGSPADIQLNFAIFLLSIAASGFFSIAATTFTNPRVEMYFGIVVVSATILGVYLLISWIRNRTSLKEVCRQIRERIPPEAEPGGPPEAEAPVPPK